ncbi:aerial mycelium formation protein [Angustibacter sp. McL0619]|uniref:RsiG family protein n=1 Tax=Angustibacter sp. McL0619 TaxID=3415676 RepID=UPI003CECAB16
MTTESLPGGRRPIDRVLADGFADDLPTLSFDELRERRHLAEQEEVDLSFARRLLQGRLDLLRSEQQQREHPADAPVEGERTDAELARDLSLALADAPRADHGLGRHMTTDPTRVGEHRRAAEQAVDDVRASDPSALSDSGIVGAIEQLGALEQQISDTRHQVQAVMDLMSTEVARRYREGEARVEDVLTAE